MQRPPLVARTALLALALASTAGCRSAPDAVDMSPREAYQEIANNLPRADFGWGAPSGLAEMAASSRQDRPRDQDPIDLTCNETSMRVVVEVFRPRVVSVPFSAIEDVSYTYSLFPNLAFCLIFPFLQLSDTRVVFDARKIGSFFESVEAECDRLEHISAEVGMGGPYEHAQQVREKLKADAAEFGEGRVSLHFSYTTPCPPWIPLTARARRTAEAFQWVKLHPSEPPH
jgi:hypothetical protein